MTVDDVTNPPSPPRSARAAALRTEMTTVPPVRHGKAHPTRTITWRSIAYMFLPYLVLAFAASVTLIALWKGRS